MIAFRALLQNLTTQAPTLLLAVQQIVQQLERVNQLAAERDGWQDRYVAKQHLMNEAEDRRMQQQIEICQRKIDRILEDFPTVKTRLRAFVQRVDHMLETVPVEANVLLRASEHMRQIQLIARGGPAYPDLTWASDYRDLGTVLSRLEEMEQLTETYERELMQKESAEKRRALLEELARWQQQHPNGYASVEDFCSDPVIDMDWAMRQLEIFSEQGYVELSRTLSSTRARITPHGWYSLEQPETVFTGQTHSTNFHVVNSPGANVANLHYSPAASVVQTSKSDTYQQFSEELDRVVEAILQDRGVSTVAKQDVADDADRLKTELQRAKPDREAVWKWFDRLSKVGGTAKFAELVTSHLAMAGDLLRHLLP